MIFQLLDDRNECYGIYGNNEFIYDRVPDNIRRTWSWDHRLAARDIDYASIYCAGKTMADVAPENLRHRLEKREAKIKAFVKSAHDIKQRPIVVDHNVLKNASKRDNKALVLLNMLNGQNKPIQYDIWGSVTGRLTTKKGSFPIMNLKKEIANCVVPTNDIFVQFDLNGAEIRTFIALSTGTHPKGDIHLWIMMVSFALHLDARLKRMTSMP